jgi:tRNA pseudouridine55 synthase
MDGLLVIDKPAGCTSHDVVQRVRKILNVRRAGHGGTLDPDATGVLLVAVGQATRLFPFMAGQDKTYAGAIRLGFSTDTYDASGTPTSPETTEWPLFTAVGEAMARAEGDVLQTPPPYSAKKVGGVPGYKLARARKPFALAPVRVVVHSFRPLAYEPPIIRFEARCSAGTYVRSLAHDLGTSLGCGAHLLSLRRTAAGSFTDRKAVSLEALAEAAEKGETARFITPLEGLLPDLPAVTLTAEGEARVANGSPLFPEHIGVPDEGRSPIDLPAGTVVRVFDRAGRLRSIAKPSPEGGRLLPCLVLKSNG